jgi:hypothetical protein
MIWQSLNVQKNRIKYIACATVIEEMRPLLPPGAESEVLDFGMHVSPEKLKESLQRAINSAGREAQTVVLGYGLCSNAVVGLKAPECTLIIPRVDDCIALFLGSTATYRKESKKEPGTYYLTQGWIEVSDTPFEEYVRMKERYGKERADRIMHLMLKNYKRLAYIDTGRSDQESYRAYAQKTARKFNLRYEEIPGNTALIRKMIHGPWDEEFVVVQPGETVMFADFRNRGV